MATFDNSGASLDEADVRRFEEVWKLSLPRDYRRFLFQQNGGWVEPAGFDVPSGGGGGDIQYFFSLGKPFPIEDAARKFKHPDSPRVPPEYLPIAKCVTGDLLCLVVEGPQEGQIFFWDHEEEGDEKYTFDNLYFVARGIDDLLENLK